MKNILKGVHTRVVEEAKSDLGVNKVLQAHPPPVDASERLLPRQIRTTLSQLRSGYCARLNSYRFKIGASGTSLCPDCNAAEESSSHIFDCPAHPTTLTKTDLWERPWNVAAHLVGVPAFADLPDPGPPPPRTRQNARPPPEPPPSPTSPLGDGDSDSFSTLSLNSSLGE